MTASPEEGRLARALDRMAKVMFAIAAGGMIALLGLARVAVERGVAAWLRAPRRSITDGCAV